MGGSIFAVYSEPAVIFFDITIQNEMKTKRNRQTTPRRGCLPVLRLLKLIQDMSISTFYVRSENK